MIRSLDNSLFTFSTSRGLLFSFISAYTAQRKEIKKRAKTITKKFIGIYPFNSQIPLYCTSSLLKAQSTPLSNFQSTIYFSAYSLPTTTVTSASAVSLTKDAGK